MRTSLVAVVGTAVLVAVLFVVNRALAPALLGGPGSTCPQPDCALGAGLWLIAGAVVAILAALVAGLVLGSERAVRRGLLVALCCAGAYLIESIVVWILI
ncbi:hypothetical protein GCM10009854_36100 [Saccharopolyspora halophila]|uniref:Uncharacterized protein n=1 Tax=Saccharopolyspora halophila TaxID=405551 RepID=A0ABP5TLG8_9PSEU